MRRELVNVSLLQILWICFWFLLTVCSHNTSWWLTRFLLTAVLGSLKYCPSGHMLILLNIHIFMCTVYTVALIKRKQRTVVIDWQQCLARQASMLQMYYCAWTQLLCSDIFFSVIDSRHEWKRLRFMCDCWDVRRKKRRVQNDAFTAAYAALVALTEVWSTSIRMHIRSLVSLLLWL